MTEREWQLSRENAQLKLTTIDLARRELGARDQLLQMQRAQAQAELKALGEEWGSGSSSVVPVNPTGEKC